MAYPPGPYYTGDWTDQHESAREEVGIIEVLLNLKKSEIVVTLKVSLSYVSSMSSSIKSPLSRSSFSSK